MKKIILFLVVLFLMPLSYALECGSNPVAPCDISQDTVFNRAVYDFSNESPAITINESNVVLDCNYSNIICWSNTEDKDCILINDNLQNITIKNCIFNESSITIKGSNLANINITNNRILNASYYFAEEEIYDSAECIRISGQNILIKDNTLNCIVVTWLQDSYITNNNFGRLQIKENTDNLKVQNNQFSSVSLPEDNTLDPELDIGVYGNNNVLENVIIENNTGNLIIISACGDTASNSLIRNVTIRDNIYSFDYNFFFQTEGTCNFTDFYIYDNRFTGAVDLTSELGFAGGNIMIIPDITIFGNYNINNMQIYNNYFDAGIYFDFSNYAGLVSDLNISNNIFEINDLAFTPVYLINSNSSVVTNNKINNANISFKLEGSSNNKINYNNITNTNYFAELDSNSNNNDLRFNRFEIDNCSLFSDYYIDLGTGNLFDDSCYCENSSWYCSSSYCDTVTDKIVCTAVLDANSCSDIYFGSLDDFSGADCLARFEAEDLPIVTGEVIASGLVATKSYMGLFVLFAVILLSISFYMKFKGGGE